MAAAFQLPRDGLTYTQEIFTRCRNLIEKDIWKDLDLSRFRRWQANFKTDLEQYFGACILDGLIYRSQDQTVALVNQLFQRTLADLLRVQQPLSTGSLNLVEALRMSAMKGDPGFRLVTAVKQADPPTKSAHYVARLLKRRFRIAETWIIKAWEIPLHIANGIKTFFFIDDFLGTGDQFEEFYNVELIGSHTGIFAAYVPLVAHIRGIAHLNRVLPNLTVKCVETLTEGHSIFSQSATYFDDGVNNSACAQDFYFQLMKDRQINIVGQQSGGYGGLQLAYVFEHAAPDNCLPILWWRHSPQWIPLFDR